jgi:FtsZ-interacting cell division protein YlmF
MSQPDNSREGLSPSPTNLVDIFTGDEEDDDDDYNSYHPTEEQSTDASGSQDEESDEDYAGIGGFRLICPDLANTFQMRKRPSEASTSYSRLPRIMVTRQRKVMRQKQRRMVLLAPLLDQHIVYVRTTSESRPTPALS